MAETVDEAESDTGELGKCAAREIYHAEDGAAAKASVTSAQQRFICHAIVGDGRRHAAEVVGVGDVDDRAKDCSLRLS